jgi:hypothetical protein
MDANSLIPWFTTAVSAIAAVWIWFTKSYLPAHREKERDEREDRQRRSGDALSQVIALNEKLVDDKLETTNATLLNIEKLLQGVSSKIQTLETSERINRGQWERVERSITDMRDQLRQVRDGLRERAQLGMDYSPWQVDK